MSYTVHTTPRCSIVIDVLHGEQSQHITRGLLLSLESQGNQVNNCTVIPADKIGAVIATLQLAQKQLGAAS